MTPWKMLAASALFLLAGCGTGALNDLKQTAPSGSPYDVALSRAYLAYSEDRAKACDWGHSQLFAEKGLNAAYAKDTPPEDPAQWNIAASFLPELQQARETLIARATPEAKAAQPEQAAQAQLLYEQWLVTQKYGWDVAKIQRIKQEFYASVEALGQPAPVAALAQAAPQPSVSTSYIIFFGLGRSALDKDAQRIVQSVVDDLKSVQSYEVILNGHTDRSGSAMANLALSQKRADTVKKALVAKGLAAQAISVFAFGESDPKVPTKDGVKEPKNRRVEIFLSN